MAKKRPSFPPKSRVVAARLFLFDGATLVPKLSFEMGIIMMD
jgi:hypothetical protein